MKLLAVIITLLLQSCCLHSYINVERLYNSRRFHHPIIINGKSYDTIFIAVPDGFSISLSRDV